MAGSDSEQSQGGNSDGNGSSHGNGAVSQDIESVSGVHSGVSDLILETAKAGEELHSSASLVLSGDLGVKVAGEFLGLFGNDRVTVLIKLNFLFETLFSLSRLLSLSSFVLLDEVPVDDINLRGEPVDLGVGVSEDVARTIGLHNVGFAHVVEERRAVFLLGGSLLVEAVVGSGLLSNG